MAKHTVKILDTVFITHDVKRFQVEKPKGYTFLPGQATEVALKTPEGLTEAHPFTFTALPTAKTLEFVIKIYDDHAGVTHQLGLAHAGDELVLDEPFGAIQYQGPGFFFAGGAGVTPFIAILRDLKKRNALAGNTLVCSNHTASDVILEEEFSKMLGKNFLNIFTRQHVVGFLEKRIDRNIMVTLVQDFDRKFYVCGPDGFVANISAILKDLGAKAESIIFEA